MTMFFWIVQFVFCILSLAHLIVSQETPLPDTTSTVVSRPRVDVTIVVFGQTTSRGFNSLSISEPPCEVAVDDLAKRYNQSFRFIYIPNDAHNCLLTTHTDDDILAKYYYHLQAPGKVIILSTPGDPLGGNVQGA